MRWNLKKVGWQTSGLAVHALLVDGQKSHIRHPLYWIKSLHCVHIRIKTDYYMEKCGTKFSIKKHFQQSKRRKKRTWNEILCDNNQLYLKILDKQTGEFWGEISLKDLENDIPELGIHILREYRNRGIGTKVEKCFIENLRRVKGLQCLSIRICSDNYVSQRLFEHLGAVKVGEEGKAYCNFMKK